MPRRRAFGGAALREAWRRQSNEPRTWKCAHSTYRDLGQTWGSEALTLHPWTQNVKNNALLSLALSHSASGSLQNLVGDTQDFFVSRVARRWRRVYQVRARTS